MTDTAWVTCEEAARIAHVSPRTIRRWRARGLVAVRYPGPTTPAVFNRDDVLRAAKAAGRVSP